MGGNQNMTVKVVISSTVQKAKEKHINTTCVRNQNMVSFASDI